MILLIGFIASGYAGAVTVPDSIWTKQGRLVTGEITRINAASLLLLTDGKEAGMGFAVTSKIKMDGVGIVID